MMFDSRSLKTSLTKWRADYDLAAQEYQRAGKIFYSPSHNHLPLSRSWNANQFFLFFMIYQRSVIKQPRCPKNALRLN